MESERRPMSKTKTNDRRYGGADRICEVRAEKDMLLMMVGRNTGKEAKETLMERKINACNHGIKLVRVLKVGEDLKRDAKFARVVDVFPSGFDESLCWFSSCSRSRATFRSLLLRYLAVSGESGMKYQAKTAVMMLGKPSNRNKARHGSIGPFSLSLTMTHARLLAKLVASGAAEI